MAGKFARPGIKTVNARFIKLDSGKKANKAYRSNGIRTIVLVFLMVFLLANSLNVAEAGKITDIRKRSRTSVFLPKKTSREIALPIFNAIFSSPMETVIVSGPENNTSIQSTGVEFILDGWQIFPFKRTTLFDVWLVGYDTGWREVYSRVSYDLPPGKKTYTFFAHSKNQEGEYDASSAARTFTVNVSPYFGQFSISNVYNTGTYTEPNYERLTIRNDSSPSPVNVSGWKILAKRFNFTFEIPAASRLLDTRNLYAGDRIVLNIGDMVDIYVGKRSPFGVNFQENSCTSYLGDSFESYDSLSWYGSCPLPDPGLYNQFSVDCRTYLRSIGSCSMPQLEYYQFATEPECRDFILKNYNYQACVQRAKGSDGFYSGRWRVYMARGVEILDDLNDEIYLYDGQGLLVNVYKY